MTVANSSLRFIMLRIVEGDCTSTTCPVGQGWLSAPPSLEGAALILAVFAILVPINLWTGARCRTTTYSLTLIVGLFLEVVGYVGRLLLRSNLASKSYFVLFMLGTTMGPTFITAAIYMVLPHVMAVYGSDLSIIAEPIWLSYFFLGWDIFTLAFQAIGSAFAAEGSSKAEVSSQLSTWYRNDMLTGSSQIQQGINVLIAGLGLQILSILGFFGLYYWHMSRVHRNRDFLDPRFSAIYQSAKFKLALLCKSRALL